MLSGPSTGYWYYHYLLPLQLFKKTLTSSQKLEMKLNKKYEKQIKIEKGKTIQGNIVCSSLMTSEEAQKILSTSCRSAHPNKRSSVVIEGKYSECRENTISRKLNFKRYS